MAAINDVITLGIGTPSSVKTFITGGLQISSQGAAINAVISQGIGNPASIKDFILYGLQPNALAAPVFVDSYEDAGDTGTAAAVTTTASSGNLLVAVVAVRNSDTFGDISGDGWTVAQTCQGEISVAVYYRIAAGSDSFEPTWNSSSRYYATVAEYVDVPASPYEASAEDDSQISAVVAPAYITTGAANAVSAAGMAVFVHASRSWDAWDTTTTLSVGEIDHQRTSGSDGRPGIKIGHVTYSSGGSKTATWTTTDTGGSCYGAVLLFKTETALVTYTMPILSSIETTWETNSVALYYGSIGDVGGGGGDTGGEGEDPDFPGETFFVIPMVRHGRGRR